MPEVRLIDANSLKYEMEIAPLYAVDMYTACAVIDAAHTIEPEVRHGRWIPYGRDSGYNSFIRCSHCNHEVVMYADSEKTEPKYCEECGYRMGATDTNVGGKGGADNG